MKLTSLQILERIADADNGYDTTASSAELKLFKELASSGYIIGQIGPDTHDSPDTMIEGVSLTTDGRLLMERMQEERNRTAAALLNEPIPHVPLTPAFLSQAVAILAESYTTVRLVEIMAGWAKQLGRELPFSNTTLPVGTTKKMAVRENLMAFGEKDRFTVVEDMATNGDSSHHPKMEELRQKLRAIAAGRLPISTPTAPTMQPPGRNSNTVFVVHGHDEANLYKLKEMLRDRFQLDPIILSGKPGRGRTIIEKFEAEAALASFAFVLLTPDDIIKVTDGEYGQARPNVVFELGWFYGRLGREKVCILFKKGTKIHSDLDGISRIEFRESVTEKIEEIEKELAGR